MKRALRLFILIFLILAGDYTLHAQTAGLLYSIPYYGGIRWGTINVFDPVADTDNAPLDFNTANGGAPYGSFIQTKDGMLWGMTAYFGKYGPSSGYGGVIFNYNIATNTQTVLHNFEATDSDGYDPFGSLVMDTNNGLMYGVTWAGETRGANTGTLFSFNPVTDVETVLTSLRGVNTGYNPTGSPILVNDTMLYCLCSYSRGNGPGTIFSYDITTNIAKICFTFNDTDGNYPRGNLFQVNDSMLYGLTLNGGTSGDGVLFKFNINTNVETVLHNFTGTPDGAHPGGSLMMANDGYLYGMTEDGGTKDSGTLFRFNIDSNTVTVLYSFGLRSGYQPYADVIQATDGKLYGNTNMGGLYGTDTGGTIFSYDITTKTFKMLYSYNAKNGEYPYGDFLEVFSAWDSVVNNKCPNDVNGSITIYERGGIQPLTYHWSNGATTSSITGLPSGIDTGWVTDGDGISFIFIDTIKPLPMLVTFNIANPCAGDSNGSVGVNISGGTAPFTYNWSNGDTGDSLMNLSVGTYTVNITDANGCPGTGSVTITQAAPMVIDSIVATPQTCPTCNNGIVHVYVRGGTPPGDTACYLYLWSNAGPDSSIITNLDTGSYFVCVTSCYGCGTECSDTVVVITGTENLSAPGSRVEVYPVPSTGPVTVVLKGSGFENLMITDAFGREVYTENLSPQLRNNIRHLDLSGQPNGVYILHINAQNAVLTGKIIIQK